MEHKEFAKIIGVTPATISNYICAHRRPSRATARLIEEATAGKVTRKELWEWYELLNQEEE